MTDPARPASQRTLPRRLFALSLGCLLAFALGEAYARGVYGAPWAERRPLSRIQAHPTRGWEMVPGEAHFTYTSHVEVNSLGLRGPELGPRREGERRVLVLGDSLTYGQGVGEAETLPALTQEALRAEGGDWRVVNGGLRAYATNQELALLEELAPVIEPDLVVLAWYWNDLVDSNVQGNFERLTRTGPVAFDLSAPATGTVLWKWRAKQLLRSSALLMQLYDLLPKEKREAALEPARRAELLARFGEHLDRFEALAEEHGFRFGVFLVPDSNVLMPGSTHPSHALSEEVRALLSDRGIPVTYDRGALTRAAIAAGAAPVIPYDGHFTAEGNRILAGDLARFVRELADRDH